MKRIHTMITAFRDGFQSVFGGRVLTDDFLPALKAARSAGLEHFEVGGGARFQSLYFYCNEDAFEMMDAVRNAAGPGAKLQSLARGVNVVGLESQSRDVIRAHAELFKKHGIDRIRNFDALNDVKNLVDSGRFIAEAGAEHEVTVTMMGLPPGSEESHTSEFYVGVLRRILDADIPFSSVCFKDASGTTPPAVVHSTIRHARSLLGATAWIVFHSHESAGISVAQYTAAIEAGADQVDTSLAPVSDGSSQPDALTMWQALRGGEYQLDIDPHKVRQAEETFKEALSDYYIPPEASTVEPLVVFSPMPGGALTANTQMMRDAGMLDKYPEVAAAMTDVVAKGGLGTSVTPVSQFYFQQAYNNALLGPWKKIAPGYGQMVLGYFGRTPADPDPEVLSLAREQLNLEPTDEAPVDRNDRDPEKGLQAASKKLKAAGLPQTEENTFIVATCGEKGLIYLKGEATVNCRKTRRSQVGTAVQPDTAGTVAGRHSADSSGRDGVATDGDVGRYIVTVDGQDYHVEVSEEGVTVDGTPVGVQTRRDETAVGPERSTMGKLTTAGSAGDTTISQANEGTDSIVRAPYPGTVLKVDVETGHRVQKGTTVVVLESMKMETEIESPAAGVVVSVRCKAGDSVVAEQALLTVRSDS